MSRTLTIIPLVLVIMESPLYAENGQHLSLNLDFKQQSLDSIDDNSSLQDDEKTYRRNQRYMRNALTSYSKETLRSMGLSAQTVDLMGATLGLAIHGARLNLNESKTLAIEFKDVITHDPALYFGYKLDW
jgi:hypothetical protein